MNDVAEAAAVIAKLESGPSDHPFKGNYRLIFNEVKRVVGPCTKDILDLYQDVLLNLIEKRLPRFDPNRCGRFRNWLRVAAQYAAVDVMRARLGRRRQRNGRERQFAADWGEFDVRDYRERDDSVENRDSVAAALRQMTGESKAILKAYYGIDEPPATFEEIGRRVGLCLSSISVKHQFLIERIRRLSEAP